MLEREAITAARASETESEVGRVEEEGEVTFVEGVTEVEAVGKVWGLVVVEAEAEAVVVVGVAG
jgi:hypothetical protein